MSETICPFCFANQSKQVNSCEHCESSPNEERSRNILPLGYRLEGHIRVGRQLGEGGFGVAYQCFNTRLENICVVKELFPQSIAKRSQNSVDILPFESKKREFQIQKEAFLNEARTLAKISHDAIVRIRHFFEANGTAYFVMDFYEGKPLDKYIKDTKKSSLPYQEVLKLLMPIVNGVIAAHKQGVMHRDIKPQNVLICENGLGVLIDFGNAKSVNNSKREGVLGVSLNYAPLEQKNADFEKMGFHTDVYSLCALFYYCLTGEPPLDAEDRAAGNDLKSFSEFGVKVPELLQQAVSKGMAMSVEDRFSTVSEFESYISPLTKPQSLVWENLIPATELGNKLRFISTKIKEGKKLPISFDIKAFLLQWFWLLGHQVHKWAILSSMFGLFGLLLGIISPHLLPITVLILISNAILVGTLGNTLLYSKLENLSKSFELNSESNIAKTQKSLSRFLRFNYKLACLGFLVFILTFVAQVIKVEYQENIKEGIERAISGGSVGDVESKIQEKTSNGKLDMTSEEIKQLVNDFRADDEIERVELIGLGTSFKVTIGKAIEPVQGKQLLLKMVSTNNGISWACEPISDFPQVYLPEACK